MNKKLIVVLVFLFLSASVCLYAQTSQLEQAKQPEETTRQEQTKQPEQKTAKHFADKGIIELHGSLSLGGTTGSASYFFFSAGPGINYYVLNNFFIGTKIHADVERMKQTVVVLYLWYYTRSEFKTNWSAGFDITLGYAFKLSHNIFLSINPEINFQWILVNYYQSGMWNEARDFRAYPNIVLTLKYILNNTSINLGFRQNFFYFTNRGKSVSDSYYSYRFSLGFSFFI